MTDTDKSVRVSGWKCRTYVQNLKLFHNSNKQLFARWETSTTHDDGARYVVYSYGAHWPLYIHHNGVWYANVEKVTRTTTKHASQAHPLTQCVPLSKRDMIILAERGYTTLSANRVKGA